MIMITKVIVAHVQTVYTFEVKPAAFTVDRVSYLECILYAAPPEEVQD